MANLSCLLDKRKVRNFLEVEGLAEFVSQQTAAVIKTPHHN